MNEPVLLTIIGGTIAFLQTAIFFILGSMREDIRTLAKEISAHHSNIEIHCSPEIKKRCYANKA